MIPSTVSLSLSAQGSRHPPLSSPLLLMKQSLPSFHTHPWHISNDFPLLFFVDELSFPCSLLFKSFVRYCLVIEQHLYCERRTSLNHVFMCMSTRTVV
jgi:hypothetical protein